MISNVVIDDLDLILLDILQDDIHLVSDPWGVIGEKAGISAEEVLIRLNRLAKTGVLRGITPTLEPDTIGPIVSTLVAVRVPEEDIRQVAAVVSQYSEVSHNFRRENVYNLWFTLAATSWDRVNSVLAEIREQAGIHPEDMLDLRTEKKYKIDVRFPLLQRNKDREADSNGQN